VPDSTDPFETWLLRHVAEAVEGAEVWANLRAQVRARASEERHALALMERAERVPLPVDRLTELLAALEARPTATRELVLRRFVEAWLMQQREAYGADNHGGVERNTWTVLSPLSVRV